MELKFTHFHGSKGYRCIGVLESSHLVVAIGWLKACKRLENHCGTVFTAYQ